MDKADHIDRVEHDLEDRSADPAPIIIVQRGRATWGRELLLLLLLLATASYILYQEYRGPSIIVRNAPRQETRTVDSVPVAALSSGDLVIRGLEGEEQERRQPTGRQLAKPIGHETEEDETETTTLGDSGIKTLFDEKGVGAEEIVPNRPDGELAPGTGREAEANEDPVVDPFGFPKPLADLEVPSREGRPNPEDAEVPRRASAVIVWDQDRLDRPRLEPREETDRPDDRTLGHRQEAWGDRRDDIDRIKDEAVEREVPVQTLAQRRHFLQCLALAIRQYGRQAGPHIDGLCRDYRIPLPFEVVQLEQRFGTNVFLAGGDLEQTITSLRRLGAPENYLLEQLSEQMTRAIGARHGPRNAMEARVFAARKLLRVPLPDQLDHQASSRPSIGG